MEVEDAVIEKIRSRRNEGRAKYGKSMERDDLTQDQWLQHAQEEAMDLAIYLERLMRPMQPASVKMHPAEDRVVRAEGCHLEMWAGLVGITNDLHVAEMPMQHASLVCHRNDLSHGERLTSPGDSLPL